MNSTRVLLATEASLFHVDGGPFLPLSLRIRPAVRGDHGLAWHRGGKELFLVGRRRLWWIAWARHCQVPPSSLALSLFWFGCSLPSWCPVFSCRMDYNINLAIRSTTACFSFLLFVLPSSSCFPCGGGLQCLQRLTTTPSNAVGLNLLVRRFVLMLSMTG
eukprot:Gb_07816 [translate_table: standard]